MPNINLKPTHKPVKDYYGTLQQYADQNVTHEGAIVAEFGFPIAYWEAKDVDDDLQKAVRDKRNAGYPTDNILFQTPERAILVQTDFRTAFTEFYEICRTAINPELSRAAVEEMLVQHILTERIFRTVFDRSDFTRRKTLP